MACFLDFWRKCIADHLSDFWIYDLFLNAMSDLEDSHLLGRKIMSGITK